MLFSGIQHKDLILALNHTQSIQVSYYNYDASANEKSQITIKFLSKSRLNNWSSEKYYMSPAFGQLVNIFKALLKSEVSGWGEGNGPWLGYHQQRPCQKRGIHILTTSSGDLYAHSNLRSLVQRYYSNWLPLKENTVQKYFSPSCQSSKPKWRSNFAKYRWETYNSIHFEYDNTLSTWTWPSVVISFSSSQKDWQRPTAYVWNSIRSQNIHINILAVSKQEKIKFGTHYNLFENYILKV